MKKNLIRIAITDDHTVLRQSLRVVLEAHGNFAVVFDASNGQELLDKLKVHPVDIVLLDLEMPVMSGFEALRKVSVDHPEIKCIIMSYFNDSDFVMNSLQWGAKGFVAKNSSVEMLRKAIETIYDGGLFVDREFLQLLDTDVLNGADSLKADHPFTAREMAIIRLVCAGLTNKEIANEIEISIKTVENHRANIFTKAGVKNVAQLVLYAIQEGIIVS